MILIWLTGKHEVHCYLCISHTPQTMRFWFLLYFLNKIQNCIKDQPQIRCFFPKGSAVLCSELARMLQTPSPPITSPLPSIKAKHTLFEIHWKHWINNAEREARKRGHIARCLLDSSAIKAWKPFWHNQMGNLWTSGGIAVKRLTWK